MARKLEGRDARQPLDLQKTSKAPSSIKDQEVALDAAFKAWDGLIDRFGVEIGRDLWVKIDQAFGPIKEQKRGRGRPRKTTLEPGEQELLNKLRALSLLLGGGRQAEGYLTRRLANDMGGHSVQANMKKIQRLRKQFGM